MNKIKKKKKKKHGAKYSLVPFYLINSGFGYGQLHFCSEFTISK